MILEYPKGHLCSNDSNIDNQETMYTPPPHICGRINPLPSSLDLGFPQAFHEYEKSRPLQPDILIMIIVVLNFQIFANYQHRELIVLVDIRSQLSLFAIFIRSQKNTNVLGNPIQAEISNEVRNVVTVCPRSSYQLYIVVTI